MGKKDYVVGSGNVFEDLGHSRRAEALAKAELATEAAESSSSRRDLDAVQQFDLRDIPLVSPLRRAR